MTGRIKKKLTFTKSNLTEIKTLLVVFVFLRKYFGRVIETCLYKSEQMVLVISEAFIINNIKLFSVP